MSEISVDISELKSEGKTIIEELAEFLENKTEAEITTESDEMILKHESRNISRVHLRTLLRKFLYIQQLKANYRVIGGGENRWVVKERKIYEGE